MPETQYNGGLKSKAANLIELPTMSAKGIISLSPCLSELKKKKKHFKAESSIFQFYANFLLHFEEMVGSMERDERINLVNILMWQ